MIQFINEHHSSPELQISRLKRWIKNTATEYGFKTGDISYLLCDDAKILEINQKYLAHDYYTDIITFDYTENKVISGDIFISIDTVKSNAALFGNCFEEELHRVIIHGILHLCGQDDKTDELRREMTDKENLALSKLECM